MFLDFFKKILFPKYCFICKKPGRYLCANCFSKLKIIKTDVCFYCKKPNIHGVTHFRCRQKNGVDGCKSYFYYDFVFQKIIKKIKYKLVKEAIDDFFSLIPNNFFQLNFLPKDLSKIIVIPVPLHIDRLRTRGFNQSFEIAKHLFKDIKIEEDLIIRNKNTSPQANESDLKKRIENVKGVFSISKKIDAKLLEKTFIIFDDVLTSGSTIKEIVKILKRNGVKKVYAITLAMAK